MAVFVRLWAVAAGILALVIAGFVWLAILNFKQIQITLLHERLAVLAEVTAVPFQTAARIGMPLGGVRNADALLERARQSDNAIVGIHVADAAGRVVRSTDKAVEGTSLQMPPGDRPRWSWLDGEHLFSSVRLLGSQDQRVGSVTVEIDRAGSMIRTRAMAAELLTSAALIWAAMAGLSGLGLWFFLRPQISAFRMVEQQIEAFESDIWRKQADACPDPHEPSPGTALREAHLRVRRQAPGHGNDHA